MSTNKHIDAICWICTAVALLLSALLFLNVGVAAGDGTFTALELDGSWSTAGAVRVDLNDSGDVYIPAAGRYVLSGTLENGSILVDAGSHDTVFLCLEGANVHCETGAAVRIEQAGQVILTLAEGTDNRLSSGADYDAALADSGVDGTIFSRDDLCINGSGSLTVTAAYKHGIVCNDSLSITGGSIAVTAAQDAVHANDAVRITGAALTLNAGDDGITCKNDEGTGSLYIASGSVTVAACYEGLEGDDIEIAGGSVAVYPTDDGLNAMNRIYISGGQVYVENSAGRDADGLDSNGDLTISGGKVFISVASSSGNALDCGTENGGKMQVSGGTVIACGSSSMAEGFDSTSSQGFLMTNVSGTAGSSLKLKKADGTVLISEIVPCAYTNVVLSAPGMQLGDTCILTVGDSATELTVDNSSSDSGMFGGRGGMMGGMQLPDQSGTSDGFLMGGKSDRPERTDGMQRPTDGDTDAVSGATETQPDRFGGGMQMPEGNMQKPEDNMQPPDGVQMPDDAHTPAGGMQRPTEDMTGFGGGQFQKGDRLEQAGQSAAAENPALSVQTWLLLGASVLVLALGLVFAVKKKY